jgi:hypothetical protein
MSKLITSEAIADAIARCRYALVTAGVALLFGLSLAGGAQARSVVKRFGDTLSSSDRAVFEKWYFAQLAHGAALDAYWRKVEHKRHVRRALRRKGRSFKARHYVSINPPRYEGPSLAAALRTRWRKFRDQGRPEGRREKSELPRLADYLAAARRYYKFTPERIPEAEFKRRYAREALAAGLTKSQVLRIYALETGGLGTADMLAGIHPISRKGQPISSALGYAQLLSANTINMIAKHGRGFLVRLRAMARRARDRQRRKVLLGKIHALRAMVRTARSVPFRWSRHVALSRTGRGRGLHPLNIDGDIGPWLQVIKLAELKKLAAKHGRPNLSGAEIELMNLAGPGTGLEMMGKVARDKPTTNFFSRRAYYRNTIVRGRDAQGLLAALEGRMQANIKNDGAREFARIFDALLQRRRKLSSN